MAGGKLKYCRINLYFRIVLEEGGQDGCDWILCVSGNWSPDNTNITSLTLTMGGSSVMRLS